MQSTTVNLLGGTQQTAFNPLSNSSWEVAQIINGNPTNISLSINSGNYTIGGYSSVYIQNSGFNAGINLLSNSSVELVINWFYSGDSVFQSSPISVTEINANVAGAVEISSGSLNVDGNVSTVSTDIPVLSNYSIAVPNSSNFYTYTFPVSTSPQSHAYLVEIALPYISGWAGSEEAYAQASISWFANSVSNSTALLDALAISQAVNPVGLPGDSTMLLSYVIPASQIYNDLAVFLIANMPGGPSQLTFKLSITGYTAAIPSNPRGGMSTAKGVFQSDSEAPADAVYNAYLPNANVNYTVFGGLPYPVIIRNLSCLSTGFVSFNLANTSGNVLSTLAITNSTISSVPFNFYLPAFYYIIATSNVTGSYAFVTATTL
jgi:hypothetical protein